MGRKVKYMIFAGLVYGLIIVSNTGFGAWDHNPAPKQNPDIIDALITVPAATLDKYGAFERTRIIFNIARLIEVCNNQGKKIVELETELKKVNEMCEQLAKEQQKAHKVCAVSEVVIDVNDPNE